MADVTGPVGPKRIQLRRTRGWRKPEGAVIVSRPSRWANPFKIDHVWTVAGWNWRVSANGELFAEWLQTHQQARAKAVELFGLHIGPMGNYEYDPDMLALLRKREGVPLPTLPAARRPVA